MNEVHTYQEQRRYARVLRARLSREATDSDAAGNAAAERIIDALRYHAPSGLSRTAISNLLSPTTSRRQILRALDLVVSQGMAEWCREKPKGWPADVLRLKTR